VAAFFDWQHRRFGDSAMDTQTNHQRDFANSFWVQTAALVLVVAVLLEVAARHIW
jgi:hypothetical protein